MKIPSALDFGWIPEPETEGVFFAQPLVKKKEKPKSCCAATTFRLYSGLILIPTRQTKTKLNGFPLSSILFYGRI